METYFDRYIVSGGIMMFFLIPCSFLAVWFIFQGMINLRRSRIVPQNLIQFADRINSSVDVTEFRALVEKNSSTLSSILRRLFEMDPAPAPDQIDDLSAEFIDDEISRLYHKNNHLAVIYTISPLLGLLGTILGMMKTFYIFSMMEEHSLSQLSMGINEALITTMWGLFIAIPSFVVLYLFKQKLFYYEMTLLPHAVKNAWHKVMKYQTVPPDLKENGKYEEAEKKA